MAKVLISGGTGLVGRHLCKKLEERGYDVSVLSRTRTHAATVAVYTWDLNKKKIQKDAIETADYIIHLAGANVAEKRWSHKRKQLIIDSRVKTGQLLYSEIKEKNKKLKAFISASAIGYYGTITSDKIFVETDSAANDFLGDTCKKWEQVTDTFKDLEIRTVNIRTGVVLTKKGGALSKMTTPFKVCIGSALGSGTQYLPWIHIDDLCNIYIKAIEDKQMEGAYNAVAPHHKTNKAFSQILAHVLKRPFWFPNVPACVLKLIFGEMSEILLKGSRISAKKIKSAGYNFLFPDLESALIDLVKNKKTLPQ